jgi:serine beta-lactamase-like protein LACTB
MMTIKRFLVLRPAPLRICALLLFSFAAFTNLDAQEKGLSREKYLEIEKAVSSFMSANSIPGVGAAVVLDGQPLWSEGFGMADLANYSPATSSTLFRLGSISKPITATAILQLSGSAGSWISMRRFRNTARPFRRKNGPSPRANCSATWGASGTTTTTERAIFPRTAPGIFRSMQDSLQIFAGDPLVGKPGTKFNYSTYGYTLVGCVLEGAAAEKFVDFVRKNIFQPAGMEQTRDDDFFTIVPHRTRWYHKDKAGIVRNAGVLDSSYKIPGGGLISSADDMARFESAILADKLLLRGTRDLMWSILQPTEGKPSH